LKAFLTPIVFMYPEIILVSASSGSSPWLIISNSGQYTVYPPLRESGINSVVSCNRCIISPPRQNITQGR
jgi:hypothetical protein